MLKDLVYFKIHHLQKIQKFFNIFYIKLSLKHVPLQIYIPFFSALYWLQYNVCILYDLCTRDISQIKFPYY